MFNSFSDAQRSYTHEATSNLSIAEPADGTQEPQLGAIARFWRSLADEWVGTVPDDIACCEFECKKPDCSIREWENCETRLKHMSRNRVRRS